MSVHQHHDVVDLLQLTHMSTCDSCASTNGDAIDLILGQMRKHTPDILRLRPHNPSIEVSCPRLLTLQCPIRVTNSISGRSVLNESIIFRSFHRQNPYIGTMEWPFLCGSSPRATR